MALAEGGDVSDVVLAVPSVEGDIAIEVDGAEFRMLKLALEVRRFHVTEYDRPPLVQRIDERERNIDREFGVGKIRPCLLIIRLHQWLCFGERKFEADVGVHVTVGDVMNELADCPTLGTIRRIELLIGESVYRGAEFVGNCGDALDVLGAVGLCVGASPFEFSDGIGEVQNRRGAHGLRDDGGGGRVAGKSTHHRDTEGRAEGKGQRAKR